MTISRRAFLTCAAAPLAASPDKTVVLAFDDAVKSHLTFVASLLRDLGSHATFFISYRWMPDEARFLTWQEVAALHAIGFEIGNQTWRQFHNYSQLERNRSLPTPINTGFQTMLPFG
jgi:peptidoglycan/xylan/chitin deacetylase (PgdA/CDA1 family)